MTALDRFSRVPVQVLDDQGDPVPGALVYFYAAGTTTPLDTYSDVDLSVANSNPVVADAGGFIGDVFLGVGPYKVVFKTAADVTLHTLDNVVGNLSSTRIQSTATIATLKALGASVSPETIFLQGRTATGDGGEGMLYRSTNLGVHGAAAISGQGSAMPDGQFTAPIVDSDGNGTGGIAGLRVKSEIALEDVNGDPALPTASETITITHYDASASFAATATTLTFVSGSPSANEIEIDAAGATTREKIINTAKNMRDEINDHVANVTADRKNISSRKVGTFSGGAEQADGDYTGMYHRVQVIADAPGQTDSVKGDVITISTTGANIQVMSGQVGAAWIIAPGSGYTGTCTVSTDFDDWRYWHQHDETAGLQQGDVTVNTSPAPTAPTITFPLGDDILVIRQANNTYEYKRAMYDGRLPVEWAGAVGDGETDDSAAIQAALIALAAGKGPLVERYAASNRQSAGILWLGPKVYECGGERIYVNPAGNRHGPEINGVTVSGVTSAGNPSVDKPDRAEAGSRLNNGILTFGMPDCPNGDADYISRGASMRDLTVVGGVEFFAVQQTPSVFDCTIVPSCPVGEIIEGIRTSGHGGRVFDSSTFSFDSSAIISGSQVASFTTNTPGNGTRRLNGLEVVNCNSLEINNGIIAFCNRPLLIHAPDGETGSQTVRIHAQIESNLYGAQIQKANQVWWEVQHVSSTTPIPYEVDDAVVVASIAVDGSSFEITTSGAHGYSDGDKVWFQDPDGNVSINSIAIEDEGFHGLVANKTATTFELTAIDGTVLTTSNTSGTYSGTAGTVKKLSTVYPKVEVGVDSGTSVANFVMVNCSNAGGNYTAGVAPAYPDAGDYLHVLNTNTAVFIADSNNWSRWARCIVIDNGVASDVVAIGQPVGTFDALTMPGGPAVAPSNSLMLVDDETANGRGLRTEDGMAVRFGVILTPLAAEPGQKTNGMIVCANDTDWDPLTLTLGRPYFVGYSDSAWRRLDA